jgi:branched-chain amino acid transport system ATP-binding protein
MSASNGVALQLSELTRRFGGIFAVSGVNLRVQAGSRHGIIGPNGAGKTTLFNVISGELRASEARRRVEMGLGRTYQITRTFPTLTVRENLTLGLHGLRRSKFSMLRPWKGYQHEAREAEELSERIGLSLRLNERVANLSHGEIRQLEVALALALSPKLLLLDEPCAGLSPAERAGMSQLLRRLPSELTLVMIEHDMDVVRESVDKITVLHLGEVVAEGTTKEIERHTTVREIYLGSRG